MIPSVDVPAAPVPDLDDTELAGYFAGTAEKELRVQECSGCQARRWPPREGCAKCGSLGYAWVAVEATGSLYTWTVVWTSPLAGFADHTPYAVGVIELADDVRMIGYLDADPSDLAIDVAVTASFQEVRPGNFVPVWSLS